MDFDWQWLLIGVPLVFAMGWVAARLDLRQWRRSSEEAPNELFKGVHLLLNEEHDAAIDAFIQALQKHPATADLHFALGNLFRRRGEYERAVRVHEHLLQRADLSETDRARAQQALALDYQRAGLFDRAESAWRALEGGPLQAEARVALLGLLERARDWPAALAIAQQLEDQGQGSFSKRIAHHHCELAASAAARGDLESEAAALQAAATAAPEALRPQVQAAQRHARLGEHAAACDLYAALVQTHPQAAPLLAGDWAASAQIAGAGHTETCAQVLQQVSSDTSSADVLKAWVLLRGQGSEQWAQQLQRRPGLRAAAELLASHEELGVDAGLAAARKSVQQAALTSSRYRCAACGFESQRHFWQCPGCLSWDSFPPQRSDEL